MRVIEQWHNLMERLVRKLVVNAHTSINFNFFKTFDTAEKS